MRELKFQICTVNENAIETVHTKTLGELLGESDFDYTIACEHVLWVRQFTGLTDINGVEIYEGDIVESTSEVINPFAHRRTGEFITKRKFITYNEEKAYFTNGDDLPLNSNVCKTYYKVIGNIHQNLELMEENTASR